MNINLNNFLTDDVNIIEFFLCKDISEDDVIDVTLDNDIESIVERKYKKYKEEKYKSYHHKDKVYTYELSNDNQYVSSKIVVKSKYVMYNNSKSNLYILSSKVDKYPQYIFPCTNDIDYISTYSIKEYKVNNRISLFIRSDNLNDDESKTPTKTFYIEYRHSPNVEIDKINEYINNIVNTYIDC